MEDATVTTTTPSSNLFGLDQIASYINLGDADLFAIVTRIINVALGFLGIIFLVMILLSGFMWLFSFGNEDRLKAARRTFFNAIIGVIIIFASYSIVQFLFSVLGGGGTVTPLTKLWG